MAFADESSWGLKGKTHKKLKMSRVFLKPKVDAENERSVTLSHESLTSTAAPDDMETSEGGDSPEKVANSSTENLQSEPTQPEHSDSSELLKDSTSQWSAT